MTLGPQPNGVARRAGYAAAWASSVSVQKGNALQRRELVRASVGYPVAWSFNVWFDNGGIGSLAAPVRVLVQPGMGRGGVLNGQLWNLQPGVNSVLTGPATGAPATELIIVVETTELAGLDYTICACASPVFWWPQWGAQG
jgi:hypothetical protein